MKPSWKTGCNSSQRTFTPQLNCSFISKIVWRGIIFRTVSHSVSREKWTCFKREWDSYLLTDLHCQKITVDLQVMWHLDSDYLRGHVTPVVAGAAMMQVVTSEVELSSALSPSSLNIGATYWRRLRSDLQPQHLAWRQPPEVREADRGQPEAFLGAVEVREVQSSAFLTKVADYYWSEPSGN